MPLICTLYCFIIITGSFKKKKYIYIYIKLKNIYDSQKMAK